ncbi:MULTISPECIES: flagellar basal-body MS-ring/collar protein FliF [Halopseudomonas]|jgi:flagellar M-ring protein FliF|uniref:Flagellar M-ring protein n=1 Tax=Halopseudomonas aestusnigri TaxID=857252 RepID=A0AAQ1JNY5_9GAMM|nr:MULTISPECIES: flagellar basal-body MS-ring/collar protein FliF [Halopseudomonas]MAP76209.1 flagellar basal body M-ring protein FliF [Pseudomonadales bacterium]MEE2800518.1 flagellar basal-body MS-ring/collar protein FliF [Pseudomonadota bacterium]HCP03344.1 flagellar basal body M-ring protein FliF [Pseudomonas sp.]MAY08180.1 flagellar basal body M-ring protein FliF [Pseudomonadales bacterium]MCK5531010.1 flagellar M-ring protein FliF [Halopseudomonas aestusnigri]|tara:strand:+ start:14237 stop:15952 length:1716 start_codon:yes stop_codon:yes gene_type:complete
MDSAGSNTPATRDPLGADRKPLMGLTFLDNLSQLPMLRQFGLLVGLAASVAIGFAVVLWSQEPEYRPLYNSMDGFDAGQVVEMLQQSRIDYKVEPNSGALLVRSEDLADARLRLASAGISPTDGNVGFEILDREQGLGTSQFMETTRYRRGLEGELARTISSLYNVKAARVHIAIPRSTVFVRDDRKPSASVLLEMYAGRRLEPAQVMAIVNLVATSVPELGKDEVTVVDQNGNLLSNQSELNELTVAGRQFDYTRRLEETYTRRVHNILQPVLGTGRYKAEVSADVDFSAVESTAEMFSPDAALRSEQVVTEARSANAGPQGVPGALSNQPPGATQVPEQVIDPVTGQPVVAAVPQDKREQAVRNYELDRQISHTRQQLGRLKRLSVAVVVDDPAQVDPQTGEVTRTPISEAEMARLTRLVQDAVGYDASRGDSVSVINSAFVAEAELEPLPAIPFWEQPWFWDVAKQILGILFVLVLVFAVLRPALKNLTVAGKGGSDNYPALAGGGYDGMDGGLRDDQVSLSGPSSGPVLLPPPGAGYEQQLNAIKGLLAEDPGRVAQVVKEWINADE